MYVCVSALAIVLGASKECPGKFFKSKDVFVVCSIRVFHNFSL